MSHGADDFDQDLLLSGFLANASSTAAGAGRLDSARIIEVHQLPLLKIELLRCRPQQRQYVQQVPLGWSAKRGAKLGPQMHVGKALGQGVQVLHELLQMP